MIDVLRLRPNDKVLLKFAIKFAFPFPVATIKPIANAVHSIFAKQNYATGFFIQVFSENADFNKDEPILSISTNDTAKLIINLRCINDRFFLCRADCLKNGDNDNMMGYFFYENLMAKMKHLRKCFPDHEISFRQLLIEHL